RFRGEWPAGVRSDERSGTSRGNRRLNQSLTLRRKIPYRKMRDFLVYSGQDSIRRARRGSNRRRFRDKPGEQAAEPIPHSPQKNPLSKDEGFFVLQRSGFDPK